MSWIKRAAKEAEIAVDDVLHVLTFLILCFEISLNIYT